MSPLHLVVCLVTEEATTTRSRVGAGQLLSSVDEAGLVHVSHEHLQPNDRVDYDDEQDQQCNLRITIK